MDRPTTPRKINIVAFWPANDWGRYGRTYENILLELSTRSCINHVTCILPPQKAAIGHHFFRHEKINDRLQVITPYWRSINYTGRFFRLRRFINRYLSPEQALSIFLLLQGYTRRSTVFWAFPPHPYLETIFPFIRHRHLVTQIIDNNTKLNKPEAQRALAQHQYNKFAEDAQLLITSSTSNFKEFSKINPNCILTPNAVSAQYIAKPSTLPFKKFGRRPRLGYVGFISQRTDVDLLHYVAEQRPEYDLLIAGPDEGYLSSRKITKLDNVSYLGAIPNTEVPNFLQGLDVCLMPHIVNEYSESMSPLKLYQYLASGRPVVTTPVAGTEKYKDLLCLASTYNEFIEKIDESLQHDDFKAAERRISAMNHESWESRVDDILHEFFKIVDFS